MPLDDFQEPDEPTAEEEREAMLAERAGSAESIQEAFGDWLRIEWRAWKKANPGFIPRYTMHLFFDDRQEDWMAYITPRAYQWHRERGLRLIIEGGKWMFEMPDPPNTESSGGNAVR